jgi:flagellar basal body rod protein FlgC
MPRSRATQPARDDVARFAERIRSQPPSGNLAGDMVGLMVSQRAAEANLVVAHVADEMGQSLIHVIA